MIVCPCGLYDIGKTVQKLKDRFHKHKSVIIIGKDTTPLVQRCKEHNYNVSSLRLMGIDQITSSGGGIDKNTLLLRREAEWIFRHDPVTTTGLNDSLNLSCFSDIMSLNIMFVTFLYLFCRGHKQNVPGIPLLIMGSGLHTT
ncbi:hypothetical protein XELAEV_18015623mg [Xenopus laevis]|uniref:Uncharacterized protein n=1 Tax=Xenopus laevis TaxID=8355 RepID=A0A974HW45_XENLA|nr:hypothetical protein XELAEV_18015623mg [Xenopus laevis]